MHCEGYCIGYLLQSSGWPLHSLLYGAGLELILKDRSFFFFFFQFLFLFPFLMLSRVAESFSK